MCGAPVQTEPDPDSVLSFPMRWRWVCANGHVMTVGIDLGAQGGDRTVETEMERQADGSWKPISIREIK